MLFKAKIFVTLRKSVFDPQGQTVLHALESLGFSSARDLRVGKFFELTLEESGKTEAEKSLRAMCEKLLVNTVIEDYTFELQ